MNEVEIKKLVINMGEKELSLTMEEAKKLKECLEELFEKKVIVEKTIVREEVVKHYPSYPPYPSKPLIWYGNDATDVRFVCSTDEVNNCLSVDIE